MNRCLITGCRFVDPRFPRFVWGDLHEIGGAFVFRANRDSKGEVDWSHKDVPEDGRRAVVFRGIDLFVRDGVIVAPVEDCRLNAEAAEYIA